MSGSPEQGANIPILQMRKSRHREVKLFTYGHMGPKRLRLDLNLRTEIRLGALTEELILSFCKWDAFRGGDAKWRRKYGRVLVCNL